MNRSFVGCVSFVDVSKEESKTIRSEVLDKDKDDGPYLIISLSQGVDVQSGQAFPGKRTEVDPKPSSVSSFHPDVSLTKLHPFSL